MKVASFDIGVANLAYCIVENDKSPDGGLLYKITEWDVIDIANPNVSNKICEGHLKNGNKCTRKAIHIIDSKHICQLHNPDKAKYKVPTKRKTELIW